MSEHPVETLNPTHDRYAWRARFLSRLNRLRNLITSKWWVLLVGAAIGAAAAAGYWQMGTPLFMSVGRMIVSIKLSLPEGSLYTEELSNFLGTQAALMQSGVVTNRAAARVLAQNPNRAPHSVSLKVTVLPKTALFVLQATGTDAEYTQAYLEACMEEYVNLKHEMRTQTSDTTLAGLEEEVLRLQKELRKCDEELVAFQSSNSVVLLQEQGNSAGSYLAMLNQRLAALKSEYELLQNLTLDQDLERRQQTSVTLPTASEMLNRSAPSGLAPGEMDYLKAKQQIILLKADLDDQAQFLKPKHPKMIALSEDIARQERLLEIYRRQSADQLESHKSSLALQIKNLEKDAQEWDAKNLEISRKTAEYQRLKADATRTQALYDRLLATMQTLDVNKEISPESVTMLEKAAPAIPNKPPPSRLLAMGLIAGLFLGIFALVIIDRLDDRMNSFSELTDLFDEEILGQVPREKPQGRNGELRLIDRDDDRHSFTESYRNLRSSILYMTDSSRRPKTVLLTSSVPNEGKSMTAANLSIMLANGGARVLLVDADLRKGILHSRLGVEVDRGLTETLADGVGWETVVKPTHYANLWLLPRGAATHHSSELFLTAAMAQFLTEAQAKYDFIILDTAPVMAADDVTSLAPHMNAVLFVLRAEHTSARIARAALDLLYQRQVKVMGIVFNAVRPNSVDYYYYYKYKDYYTPYPAGSPRKNGKAEKKAAEKT